MTAPQTRALDTSEARLVEQAQDTANLSDRELSDLATRLRERRDRTQRMIRTRTRAAARDGRETVDGGAREKKHLLVQALGRVTDDIARRRAPSAPASAATDNLREAVQRRARNPGWTGPDDRTANLGPAETPNRRIAPSGALHAEGMRAAISRSTGDR